MVRTGQRVYRATLWALVIVDAVVGILMFVSPQAFGLVADFPVRDVPVMRGYGERIALLSVVYGWILLNSTSARRLLWLPLVDEAVNTLADAYEWVRGGLPGQVVVPMLAVHALFTLALAVSTPGMVAAVGAGSGEAKASAQVRGGHRQVPTRT